MSYQIAETTNGVSVGNDGTSMDYTAENLLKIARHFAALIGREPIDGWAAVEAFAVKTNGRGLIWF